MFLIYHSSKEYLWEFFKKQKRIQNVRKIKKKGYKEWKYYAVFYKHIKQRQNA